MLDVTEPPAEVRIVDEVADKFVMVAIVFPGAARVFERFPTVHQHTEINLVQVFESATDGIIISMVMDAQCFNAERVDLNVDDDWTLHLLRNWWRHGAIAADLFDIVVQVSSAAVVQASSWCRRRRRPW